MRRKKLNLLCALLIACFALTGCSYAPYVRLEQRIIVQLTGIDFENGKYGVSIQYSLGKKSDGGVNDNDTKTVKSEGANIYEAVNSARASAGKELIFSQNQALILGKGVIENDALKAIEDFLDYCDAHSTSLIAGTFGKAEDLVSEKFKDEFADKNKILLILENAGATGIFPRCKIYETLSSAYNKSESFFIPILRLEKTENASSGEDASSASGDSENEEEPEIIPGGAALIVGKKFKSALDEDACQGVSMLLNKLNTESVTFLSDGKAYSLEIYKIKTKIKPVISENENQNLVFDVKLTASAEVAYNSILSDSSYSEAPPNSLITKLAEETVKTKLRAAAKKTALEGADILMLEDALKHYAPAEWLKSEDDWTNLIKTAEFNIEVKIKIV